MNRLSLTMIVVGAIALALVPPSRATSANDPYAAVASQFITALDLDQAREALRLGDPDSLAVRAETARLAVYEADCGTAVGLLGDRVISASESIAQLRDIAVGCERVTASTNAYSDDDAGVLVRYQDEHDEALTPLIVETVKKARDSLTRDIGATWPKPTRIIVVRDLLSLSAMTGLPYESARTTGTVAVAKWGRVTLLSPRASPHGYAWRDTLAHELTHLAVTRSSHDKAPLWLQEGLAKREEVRWRPKGPFDDRPPPEDIAVDGIRRHIDVALDKLGPSLAMLPSAEAAGVAFAEVTSFVGFLAETAGEAVLPRLLAAIADTDDVDRALVQASGANRKQWDERWRASLAPRIQRAEQASLSKHQRPPAHPTEKHAHGETRRLPPYTGRRLAELLLERGHAPEALMELDAVPVEFAKGDPRLAALRALVIRRTGAGTDLAPLLSEPRDMEMSYPPWWTIRGLWARDRQEDAVAEASFAEAIAGDPFDATGACEREPERAPPSSPPSPPEDDGDTALLCEAARAWSSVPVGLE